MSSKQTLKCPHPGCLMWYTNVAAYRQHVRHHPKQRSLPPPSPPDKLFSRRSHDTADGAFDFLHILDEDNEISFDTEPDPDSDVDSYYSDSGMIHNRNHSGDHDHDNDEDEDEYIHDDDYLDSNSSSDNTHSNCNKDGSLSDYPSDYFIGRAVADDDIPICENVFAPIQHFSPPSSFITQVRLQADLFARNKGSLKMYDDVIKIINAYTLASDFSPHERLLPKKKFISRMEYIFNTDSFKPTHGSVTLHDGSLATVPVFNIKAMILSILHDSTLMRPENFAEGLDVFTGNVDNNCEANNCYGEIHTGERWIPAKEQFCGTEGKYMPFGIIIFGDKSHTDLHGTLSVTPITFTASFFNKRVRNNPDCWRPIAYIPNLAYGKSKAKSAEKAQDEHNCLAYGLKSLIDLADEGGIRTARIPALEN
jgi:hypothetical protein